MGADMPLTIRAAFACVLATIPVAGHAQEIADDGLNLSVDANLPIVETTLKKQSDLTGTDVRCAILDDPSPAPQAYFGRVRIGNKHHNTDADENGGTINLCLPIGLTPDVNAHLQSFGIFAPHLGGKQHMQYKESNASAQCNTNWFMINYSHYGDENGNSWYQCSRIYASKNWQLKWGPLSIGNQKQSTIGPFTCAQVGGLLMTKIEHHGDENKQTYFTCTVPRITATYEGTHGLFNAQGINVKKTLFAAFGKNNWRALLSGPLEATNAVEALDLVAQINTDPALKDLPGVWRTPFSSDMTAVFGGVSPSQFFMKYCAVTDLDSLADATILLEGLKANWSTDYTTLQNASTALGMTSVYELLFATYPSPTVTLLKQLIAAYSTTDAKSAVADLLSNSLPLACAIPRGTLPRLLADSLTAKCP
jgi:hypothetical protein